MTTFNRIKETADAKGLSLRKVAELSGLGETSIYGWKKKHPAAQSLQKVADTLNVSVDYLLGNSNEKDAGIVTVTKKTTDAELDRLLDSTESYDGKELNDQDRKTMKDLIKAYVRNKPE